MVVLVLFIVTLACQTSCQESTEKNLNQMLDQLIEETIVNTFSNENENHSRIIYVKPENITSRRYQKQKLNNLHSSEYEDLQNLVQQIERDRAKSGENSVVREITVEIERTADLDTNDSGFEIINDGVSKSGRPLYEDITETTDEKIMSQSETNTIHQYPEIVIEKITYDDDSDNEVPEGREFAYYKNDVNANKNQLKDLHKEAAATALDSILKLLMKDTQTKSLEVPIGLSQDDINALVQSTHIHNAYNHHMINDVPLAYRNLAHGKMLIGNVPGSYKDLHNVLNAQRTAYPNLQINRWGVNPQKPLMTISREPMLNHIHYIPKSLNIAPRLVYQHLPVYHRHQYIK